MIKKKLNICLLLSLVALFIGSFSISYARTFTEEQLKNYCYNQLNRSASSGSNIYKNTIANMNLSGWVDIINRYQGRWYIYSNDIYVYMCCFTDNIYETTQNGQRAFSRTGGNFWIQTFSFNSSVLSSWNDSQIHGFGNPTMYYFDCNVYTNSNLNSVSIFAGTYKPNDRIFNENESSNDYFSFLLNSSLPTMIINNNSVPYYNLQTNQADSFTLGQLGLAKNFSFAELDSYRYQNGDWKHVGTNTLYNIGTTTNDLISVTIPGNIVNSNTLYTLTMYSLYDSDFPNISQPFYITDRNTIITNGALNTDDTFSGDYYNNYNNDTNTEKVINNNNNFYDKMFKVSGDKIDEIFTNAMESIEIESGELAEFEIIKNYLQGEPRRFYYIVAVHIRQTLR